MIIPATHALEEVNKVKHRSHLHAKPWKISRISSEVLVLAVTLLMSAL